MIESLDQIKIRKNMEIPDSSIDLQGLDEVLDKYLNNDGVSIDSVYDLGLIEQTKYNDINRCTNRSKFEVPIMDLPIPPWGVIRLKGPSIEAMRKSFFEMRAKGAVLFDLRFDTFGPRGSPESRARFGVQIVQTASFLKNSSIASLRPGRYGGMVPEKQLPESARIDYLRMIASQGFSWMEVEEDLPKEKRDDIISLARRAGTRIMITRVLDEMVDWTPPADIEKNDIAAYKVIIPVRDSSGLRRAIRTSANVRNWLPGKEVVIEPMDSSNPLSDLVVPLSISDMTYINVSEIYGTGTWDNKLAGPTDRWSVWRSLGIVGNEVTSDWSLWKRRITTETSLFFQMGNIKRNGFRSRLFNAHFNKLSMDSFIIPWETELNDLEAQMQLARSMGLRGIFIEMPLRSNVVNMMEWTDPRSRAVGSIDIVSFRGGKSCGFNSEIYGIGDQIHITEVERGSRSLVLGTGASGRSAAVASSMMGMETYLAGNNLQRSKDIAEKLGGRIRGISYKALSKPGTKFDLIINSIPFETRAMKGNVVDSLEVMEMVRGLEPSVGMDLYFNVQWTPFLSSIESRGGTPISGVDILTRSTMRAFKLLTGKEGNGEIIRKIIEDTVLR